MRKIVVAGIMSVLLFSLVAMAGEDFPLLSNSVKIEKVLQSASKAGLKDIKSVEFDDGVWKVKTKGNGVEIKYIYENGKLVKVKSEKEYDHNVTNSVSDLSKIVRKIGSKGYLIKEMEFKSNRNYWKVEAYMKNGEKFKLLVDMNGKVIRSKED